MKKLTIRFILMATLCVFTAMLLLGAGFGMIALQRANEGLARSHAIAVETTEINDIYKDASRTRDSLTRVYTDVKENGKAASNSEHLAKATTFHERMKQQLQEFAGSPAIPNTDVALRDELIRAANKLSDSLGLAFAAIRTDDLAAYTTANLNNVTPDGRAFSTLLGKLQAQNTELGKELMAQHEKEYKVIQLMVGLGMLLALVLVVGMHAFLQRAVLAPLERAIGLLDLVARGDLTQRVHTDGKTEIARLLAGIARMQESLVDMVHDVRTGAHTIATAAQETAQGNAALSARTETQASALQETAASMEELTSTVRQTADNTRRVKELMSIASETACTGGDVMTRVVETMDQIGHASRRVADIISVIDGIAFQTNILALNAAVEAARAGEEGRGFAVVASEVRTLAQRSAAAATEIKRLIGDSVDQVARGSQEVETARATMKNIVENVQGVSDLVIDIATASTEQSQGLAQVNQALIQMDDATQRNAALVEQAAAAAVGMTEETGKLMATVERFHLGRRTPALLA
jgi:methyl-accepting chemotaxis protein